jgi:hypothetical protein
MTARNSFCCDALWWVVAVLADLVGWMLIDVFGWALVGWSGSVPKEINVDIRCPVNICR